MVEGRAVRVEGNSTCPINRGGVGPRGLAAPQVLYDPDRLRTPLKRVAPKGVALGGVAPGGIKRGLEAFEPATWEEANAALIDSLAILREENRPEDLAIICGRERGLMLDLFKRFATAFGTPNIFDGLSTANAPVALAALAQQGVAEIPAYDWKRANFILSLGSGLLESSCQLLAFARTKSEARGGGAGVRARILHASPVRSTTAQNADEWMPIKPGTYGALALGLAQVLVSEDLYDADFVEQHTQGFEDWTDGDGRSHQGLKSHLESFTPERVAKICGLTPERITATARSLAASRPSFVLAGQEELLAAGGLSAAMAVHSLNALLGALERPGGLRTQLPAPISPWPEVEPDEVATAGLSNPQRGQERRPTFGGSSLDAAAAALADAPPAVALLYYSNPIYSRAQPERWRRALEQTGMVVSFSPFLDETAAECADWILPDDTWLERWEDGAPSPILGTAGFGLRQPVVERLYDTRASGDVLIEVAHALDEGVADAFPWKDTKSALKKQLVGIYKAKRGSIVEKKGSTFLKRAFSEAFWFDETYVDEDFERTLATESGRFEFFSSALWRHVQAQATALGIEVDDVPAALGLEGPVDRLCLPDHRPIPARQRDYPLLLFPYRPSTYAEGSGANQPWLNELPAWVGRETWTSEAEVNPGTAREAGLKNGQMVALESPVGRAVVKLRLTTSILPGIVRLARGAGHRQLGRYARGWGANVMELVSGAHADPLAGIVALHGTPVRLGPLAPDEAQQEDRG
ncbi:MAG: molybdopterin-dependent oxidoreductase [Planctomycetota bacterium]|nr:molybdopterin-dependent oxidoreductase [Planctomycetota bacterium]